MCMAVIYMHCTMHTIQICNTQIAIGKDLLLRLDTIFAHALENFCLGDTHAGAQVINY